MSPTTDAFVADVVAHQFKARLRQFYTRRATSLPAATSVHNAVQSRCQSMTSVPINE